MTTAKVRTILGDDPHTLEDDQPADLVEVTTPGVVCVEVKALGHLLFHPGEDGEPARALFTQGPGKERLVDVVRTETGYEATVIKNARGQRRMVVVIEEAP